MIPAIKFSFRWQTLGNITVIGNTRSIICSWIVICNKRSATGSCSCFGTIFGTSICNCDPTIKGVISIQVVIQAAIQVLVQRLVHIFVKTSTTSHSLHIKFIFFTCYCNDCWFFCGSLIPKEGLCVVMTNLCKWIKDE